MMDDRLVVALDDEWLDAGEEMEREASNMDCARAILLAARAALVAARRAARMALMLLVAAWTIAWYPMVPVVS
jgi:hypothetical protein